MVDKTINNSQTQNAFRMRMKPFIAHKTTIIATGLYVFINSLFVFKYVLRVCSYAWIVLVGYWAALAIGMYLVYRLVNKSQHITHWLVGAGVLSLLGGILLQFTIDPYSVQVDRWSAIHNWIAMFLQGDYPYLSRTHLGGYGSPFPVWQLLHMPFYLLGNVAISTFVIVGLWLFTLTHTQSSRAGFIGLAMLVMAPAFWYEVSVRSDLLANMLLIATLCQWLIYKQVRLSDYPLALGFVVGLVLSTRLIAAIPMAVLYGYEFIQTSWRNKLVFVITVLLTFGLTFMPFVLWNGSTLLFSQYSPFVLQTRQGSPLIFLIWTALAIGYVCYFQPNSSAFSHSTALLLFVLITMACIQQIYFTSLAQIFTESTFDITYFSTALPFLILYFTHNEYSSSACHTSH